MRKTTAAMLAAPFIFIAAPADASGGLGCTAQGSGAKIELNGGITRGMGSPLFSFSGTFEATDKKIPADLRKAEFALDNVAQYWLDGDSLRLVLYTERTGDPFGSVQVTVLTTPKGDENEFAGTFAAEIYDGKGEGKTYTIKGEIGCFVE